MAANVADYVSTTGGNIISSALPDIARSFQVSSERAAQTLSVYFFAFAAGVALWGWLSDWFGRRPAIIAGLICYGTGSAMAIVSTDFSVLLLARMVAATGAAAESVVVQTMLRDSYESTALARVFSVMGAALALSPVFGLVSGGWLVSLYGHSRNCNCLWHSYMQRVEPGAAPLSRTDRSCGSIVRLELLLVTGNDAGARRHGAATGAGSDNLCAYVSFVQCVTWVYRRNPMAGVPQASMRSATN